MDFLVEFLLDLAMIGAAGLILVSLVVLLVYDATKYDYGSDSDE